MKWMKVDDIEWTNNGGEWSDSERIKIYGQIWNNN